MTDRTGLYIMVGLICYLSTINACEQVKISRKLDTMVKEIGEIHKNLTNHDLSLFQKVNDLSTKLK